MKFVALFPGQGAQYPGMGRSFYEAYPDVREIFEEASDILKKNMPRLIFDSDEKELLKTENCQAALFVVSFAIFEVVKRLFPKGKLSGAAGLSLGEYTALAASKAASFSDLLQLVTKRGAFMDAACREKPGGMLALLGFNAEEAESLVKAANLPRDLFIANYNAPGQIVVSGGLKAIEKLKELFQNAGNRDRTKKMVPLDVDGAFHTPYMRSAEEKLAPFIEATSFCLPEIPVVMNISARKAGSIEELKEMLEKQVSHPVRWEDGIRRIETNAPDLYLQCGPGKALAAFNKRIGVPSPTLTIEKIEELEKLETFC